MKVPRTFMIYQASGMYGSGLALGLQVHKHHPPWGLKYTYMCMCIYIYICRLACGYLEFKGLGFQIRSRGLVCGLFVVLHVLGYLLLKQWPRIESVTVSIHRDEDSRALRFIHLHHICMQRSERVLSDFFVGCQAYGI